MLQTEDEPLGDAKLTIPALAKKVFAGLRVLHVVCNTGAGGKLPWGREAAIRAVQLANKHIAMFPESNQTEFRGWCKGKKVRIGSAAAAGGLGALDLGWELLSSVLCIHAKRAHLCSHCGSSL